MPLPKNEDKSVERTKRVTLQDIADVAGVKKMVVSNALNNTRSVAPATREKIQRIARELNYIPNFAARALTTGRTGIIAVVSGKLTEPYYAQAVDELERHIRESGFNLMLMRTPKEVKELMSATGNIAVDGAIAIDMLAVVREFRSHPTIPCVSISTFEQSFVDCIIINLGPSVEKAVDIMIKAGRQRVAYLITAPIMALDNEARMKAYLAAMKKANREPEIINVSTDEAHAVVRKFKVHLEENGCPDALLCQNDETAMSAFRAFTDLGVNIPDDVLLVGCDGQRHMRYFNPPLSTIVQPLEEVCALAWQFLEKRIANPNLPHQEAIVPGNLIVRKSLFSTATATKLQALSNTESEEN